MERKGQGRSKLGAKAAGSGRFMVLKVLGLPGGFSLWGCEPVGSRQYSLL